MAERKIVIAMDGSLFSKRAFDFYQENLHMANDMILVIHASEMPTIPAVPSYGLTYYDDWCKLVEKANEEMEILLQNIGKQCQKYKDRFKLFKEQGSPGEVICKFAKDEDAVLIVLGSRGQSTIRRTFLGSVSDYCVHHAHVPVVVVPAPQEHEKTEKD